MATYNGCAFTFRLCVLAYCDVYVGGKVRVLELEIFLLKTQWTENKLCIISKTVVKLKSILNNKHTNIQSKINRKVNIIPETG